MKRTQSAGGIVLNTKGEVLVVNQRGNSWSLPKGHVDPGEDVLTAARREILEESGVAELEYVKDLGGFQRHRIGLHGGDDMSELKDIRIFLFRSSQQDLRPTDPDNPEARWVKKEDVPALLTHRKDREFFLRIVPEI